MDATLTVWPFRFRFRAGDSLYFPPGKAGNILRGAFGTIFRRLACAPECRQARDCEIAGQCPYALVFEPRQEWAAAGSVMAGPSGLADWPRPFAFRAMHLDGTRVAPGEAFHFDLVLFESPARTLPYFVLAFRELAATGLGPARGRAELTAVEDLAAAAAGDVVFDGRQCLATRSLAGLPFDLASAAATPVRRVTLRFHTPTELKAAGALVERPEFGVLFRRLRDRISNLRQFYQGGPLPIDFTALAAEADRVRLVSSRLRMETEAERLSSRTGQRHPLGGFVGEASFEGELQAYLPYLLAGECTGVGRQTVWGKGCYSVEASTPPAQ